VEWGVRELLAAEDRDRLSRAEEAERFELTAVVLRLAPRRDSHWMQAPVAWVVRERRKVGDGAAWLDAPGDLAYGRNVRAPWVGDWAHGMFAATVVGGPGYGELVELEDAEALEGKGEVALEQGAGIGVLRAGSAVVLVFEAPVGAFEMKVAQGATVVAGDCLGRVNLANVKEVASTPQPVTSKRKSAAVPSGRRARRSW
jgi:phosphatidylserine decarboxylase